MTQIQKSKTELMQDFYALLEEYKTLQKQIITQEEKARKESHKEMVTTTSTYTADSIVKGLAGLQLGFSDSLENLSLQLQNELNKMEEMTASIQYQAAQLNSVNNAKIAADALFILKQEQEHQRKNFEEMKNLKNKELEETQIQKRKNWEKEHKNLDQSIAEYTTNLAREREKELTDFRYELERMYKIETDQFEENKKLLERELADTEQKKQKDWNLREKILKAHEDKFNEYKSKVDGFEEELKEAAKKAREEAIRNATREAKVKADLLEKEMEGDKQVFELKIQTLENTISQQTTQIEKLQIELKEAMTQVQSLSLKAIENGMFSKISNN